jgi:hypothetical protein
MLQWLLAFEMTTIAISPNPGKNKGAVGKLRLDKIREKKMKLGDAVQIMTSVERLGDELPFFEQLGFRQVSEGTRPHPWVKVSDGVNLVALNQDGQNQRGLTYFAGDMAVRADQLKALGINVVVEQRVKGQPKTYVLKAPSGLPIHLVEQDAAQVHKPTGESFAKCGRFGEYSFITQDLENSLAFWEQLGFRSMHQEAAPYPWAILWDGLIVLGIHQTDEWLGPAITYFGPNMVQAISLLKEKGLTFDKELADGEGTIKGAYATAPGGQRFFFFWAPEEIKPPDLK